MVACFITCMQSIKSIHHHQLSSKSGQGVPCMVWHDGNRPCMVWPLSVSVNSVNAVSALFAPHCHASFACTQAESAHCIPCVHHWFTVCWCELGPHHDDIMNMILVGFGVSPAGHVILQQSKRWEPSHPHGMSTCWHQTTTEESSGF